MERKFYTFKEISEEIHELKSFGNLPNNAENAIKIYKIIDDWCIGKKLEFISVLYCENGLYVFKVL